MTGCQVLRKELYRHVIVVILALCPGPLLGGRAQAASETACHEVIPLTHISPERGREFLSRLKLGTASRLPNTNRLLVTAPPGELQKALVVLNLVDTRTEFDILELGPASTIALPAHAEIANAVGGVSIGTFAHPPQDKTRMRAIVDVHQGMVVIVAPVFQMPEIRLAVELGPETLKPRKAPPKPLINVSNLKPQVAGEFPASNLEPKAEGRAAREEAASPVSPQVPGPGAPGSGRLMEAALMGQLRTATFNLQATNNEPPQESIETRQKPSGSADELRTESQSLSQSNAAPAPAAGAASPVAGEPATPNAVSTSKPKTSEPSPAADPARLNEPAAIESSALPGGQTAPSGPAPAAPSTTPPAPLAASSATPPVRPSAYRPEETPNGEEVLDLTLQEKMPVIQLLDLVGKYLGLSYVYNPQEVTGEVSLKLNGELRGFVRVKDLYPLLEQTLRQNNLVTTRHKGNVVTIVQVSRGLDVDPMLLDPRSARVQAGDTFITCPFELKYIDTAAAKNLLDSMNPTGVTVTPLPEKRMLLVTTYAYRMERIEQLLQIVDQPGEPRKFRFRQLRYTMAKTLAEKVKVMAEQMLESVSVTVAEPDPAASIARTPGESDVAYRTRVAQVRMQQTALRQQQALARQALGQETKPGVYLDADERTNRVLMIGAEKQLSIVEQLVDALDVEQQDLRALQLYRMRYVDAEEVARKLQELGIISRLPESSASARYGTGTARLTPQLPGQPRPPTPPGTPEVSVSPTTEVTEKGLVEEPQVVVVEATNSLLVNATAEQHAKIANIIEYVDSETLMAEIPYKIYPLKSSSPRHMAEVLQNLIQETVEQQREGGKIERMVVSREEKIKIVPDPNTCSLIVYANKKNQEWISNLIEQLDKRRPQVLIDVTLVEVTKSDVFSYDLNLIRGSPDLAATAAVSGIAPGAGSLGKFVQAGGGGLTAFYGDQQVQALLETMQNKSYGRVLAKPKLLVNDNETGKIQTTDTTYVEVTSAIPVTSGAAGTQTNLVQTSVNFTPYEAGIMLDITPHISEGELLRLDITMTRSDFLKTTATKPPDIRKNEVNTKATLPNGSTVILGGLLKMNQIKGGSGVPILSQIPLIGGLFRSINNEDTQSKLYVFVKAEIIRPAEIAGNMKDLEALSERNRMAFEAHELEFQRYEDWPGIKPKRVNPPKVLDAQ